GLGYFDGPEEHLIKAKGVGPVAGDDVVRIDHIILALAHFLHLRFAEKQAFFLDQFAVLADEGGLFIFFSAGPETRYIQRPLLVHQREVRRQALYGYLALEKIRFPRLEPVLLAEKDDVLLQAFGVFDLRPDSPGNEDSGLDH